MTEELSAGEMLDKVIDFNKLTRTEGEKGVENLNKIAKILGYKEDGFAYGSAFERFLQDNYGCVEVIREWINENADNWRDEIESEMPALTHVCGKCGVGIYKDDHGTWIDETEGDCCNEDNDPHEPIQEVE